MNQDTCLPPMEFATIGQNGETGHRIEFRPPHFFCNDLNHGLCPAKPIAGGWLVDLGNGVQWAWRPQDRCAKESRIVRIGKHRGEKVNVEQFPNYVQVRASPRRTFQRRS